MSRWELADQLGVPPGSQVGLNAQLQSGQTLLLQPRDLGRRERQRGDVRERWPAPQRQRLAQHAAGPLGVAGRERLAALADRALEALGVQLARPRHRAGSRPAWSPPGQGRRARGATATHAPARS